MAGEYRLYHELAQWWPVISPVEEYAEDSAIIRAALSTAAATVGEVLDLGSGGGHVAAHLARDFELTLVDASPQMLALSRRLNPGCRHVEADMRTLRLGEEFGAVLVHDAVDYMTSVGDLRAVITTAFVHCRPGGVAVFVPDHVADTFRPRRATGGGSDRAGRRAEFRERTWDPDPTDDWVQAEYEFLLRSGGDVRVVRETHRLGAFSRATWFRLLAEAGFVSPRPDLDGDVAVWARGTGAPDTAGGVAPDTAGGVAPDNLFIGHRPGSGEPDRPAGHIA